MGRGVGQLGAGLARIGTIAATGFAVGVGTAVKLAGDFEAQLNTINTIAKLSDSQLKGLGEGIRQTFRETGQPLEDLTSAYYDLLSAGVKVEDAQSVLNTAVKLGIGGLATTKESVDLLTTAINAYGLNASGAASASDIFAAAVRDGKVVISELNASFADVAPLASQVGVRLEEIGAAYATLTARGVPATEVGTQFNRAIIELLKPGPELIKIMKGLGLASFETSIKQKGLVATLEDVRKEAERQGIPFQEAFGRLEAYKFALATTGPNQAKFNEELVAMGEAAGETNAQFAERQQGLNFQLGKLKAAAKDAGITIGQALIPKLVPLIEKLNAFIQANRGKIEDFAQKLADGLASFASRLGTIDFSGVIGGLKILGDVGKKVVDIFLSLPPGVQGALVAGFAVNKLSGGLLGQGAGNIAGGLLKIVFQRGASPANPLWVASATGGIGGGAAVIGGGGLIGGITRFLGLTTAVGLGAILGKEIGHNIFFDPTVKPAVDFSQSALDQLVERNKIDPRTPAQLQTTLTEVNRQLDYLKGGNNPLQNALAGFLFGDQIKILEDQRNTLADLLQTARSTDAETRRWSGPFLAEINARKAAQDRIERLLAPLPFGIGQIVAKNWSPTINIANTVNAQLSVTQALTKITQAVSIRYDGKTVPL